MIRSCGCRSISFAAAGDPAMTGNEECPRQQQRRIWWIENRMTLSFTLIIIASMTHLFRVLRAGVVAGKIFFFLLILLSLVIVWHYDYSLGDYKSPYRVRVRCRWLPCGIAICPTVFLLKATTSSPRMKRCTLKPLKRDPWWIYSTLEASGYTASF